MSHCDTFYHLGFGLDELAGQIPETVLLAGDPNRAHHIAHNQANVDCEATLSENRGLNSYLCRHKNGTSFLSCTSGMGGPSLSIIVNELVQLGVQRMIRVGTCGAIQSNIRAGDVVISQGALSQQGAADDIAPANYPAVADPFLTVALVEAARRLKIPHHLGLTASTDTFYEGQERHQSSANPHLLRRLQGQTEEYRQLNILNYEMEAATLFKMAGVYGFRSAAVCGVLAERCASETICPSAKELAVERAIQLALEVLDTA